MAGGQRFPAGKGGRADQEMALRQVMSLIQWDTVKPDGPSLDHRGKVLGSCAVGGPRAGDHGCIPGRLPQ